MIGIRHVFALLLCTDVTQFFTAYRELYRIMKHDETKKDVVKRHRQLYHYARALFEAIEFYGECMEADDMPLYHGINKVIHFKKFNAWFNQPISTTPSLNEARKFSTGSGIILQLQSGASDARHPPKYIFVSWLSDFPNEEENCFMVLKAIYRLKISLRQEI